MRKNYEGGEVAGGGLGDYAGGYRGCHCAVEARVKEGRRMLVVLCQRAQRMLAAADAKIIRESVGRVRKSILNGGVWCWRHAVLNRVDFRLRLLLAEDILLCPRLSLYILSLCRLVL